MLGLLLAFPVSALAACGTCYTQDPLFYSGSVNRAAFGEPCDFWNFTDANRGIDVSHNFCRLWQPERSACCYTGGYQKLSFCDTGSFECPLCTNPPPEKILKPILSYPCRLPPTPRLDPRVSGVEPRIAGGSNATIWQYPWLVAVVADQLNNPAGSVCQGTLIHPNYVLTPAHCLQGLQYRNGTIFIGLEQFDYNIFLKCSEQHVFQETDVFCHPQYSVDTHDNDWCFIRFATPSKYPPIRLYHPEIEAVVGEDLEADALTLTIVGLGYQVAPSQDGQVPGQNDNYLHRVTQPLNKFTCAAQFFNPETMLCGGYVTSGQGPCFADDGAPLFTHRKGVYWQLGVTGFVPTPCDASPRPQLYARVNSPVFRHWLCGTLSPTHSPTGRPSKKPTPQPTQRPTKSPTSKPTKRPTKSPGTRSPTPAPTRPTPRPTRSPTHRPTKRPTKNPTTRSPTPAPTTRQPSSGRPTRSPTNKPTKKPTKSPVSRSPTRSPVSKSPTRRPSKKPTTSPTTRSPTPHPTTTYPTSKIRTLCTYLFRNTL